MNIKEDTRTLAEFYPDPGVRAQLHYAFVHRFLPGYAHGHPLNFVLHDGVDPSRFVQARWQMFERLAGQQPLLGPAEDGPVFRRVGDLTASAEETAGQPAIFMQMPTPEESAGAFFVMVVLLTPLDPFRVFEAALGRAMFHSGPPVDENVLAALRLTPCRYFTLERSAALQGTDRAREIGSLCEWTSKGLHHNFGLHLPARREAFVDAVSHALAKPLGPERDASAVQKPPSGEASSPPQPPG